MLNGYLGGYICSWLFWFSSVVVVGIGCDYCLLIICVAVLIVLFTFALGLCYLIVYCGDL